MPHVHANLVRPSGQRGNLYKRIIALAGEDADGGNGFFTRGSDGYLFAAYGMAQEGGADCLILRIAQADGDIGFFDFPLGK